MEQARTVTRLIWQRPRRTTLGYAELPPSPAAPKLASTSHTPRRRRRVRELRAIDAHSLEKISAYYRRPTPEKLRRDNAAIRLWRRLLSR